MKRLLLVGFICSCFASADAQGPQGGASAVLDQVSRLQALRSTFQLHKQGLMFEQVYGGSECTDLERYLAFSPDNQTLATCGGAGELFLVRAATGAVRARLKGARDIADVRFSPDGKRIATAGKFAEIWDLENESLVHTFVGHKNPVFRVRFNLNGDLLATVGWDRIINLWRIKPRWQHLSETDLPAYRLRTARDSPLAFTENGQRLVYNNGGSIIVLEAATGRILGTRQLHAYQVDDLVVTISRDAHWAAGAAADNSIRLFDLRSERGALRLAGHQLWVTAQVFSEDSRLLLTTGSDMQLIIWDVEKAKALASWMVGNRDDQRPVEVAISPNGKLIAVRYATNLVRMWDFARASQ